MSDQAEQDAIKDRTAERDAIRAELEATRSAFHALLNQISEADWTKKSAAQGSIGQLLVHITGYLGIIVPRVVAGARAGKKNSMPVPSGAIGDSLNYLINRVLTIRANRDTIAAKYDSAHAAALKLLDSVRDDEWEKATTYPAGHKTIPEIFRYHTTHFNEHAEHIRQCLDRKVAAPER